MGRCQEGGGSRNDAIACWGLKSLIKACSNFWGPRKSHFSPTASKLYLFARQAWRGWGIYTDVDPIKSGCLGRPRHPSYAGKTLGTLARVVNLWFHDQTARSVPILSISVILADDNPPLTLSQDSVDQADSSQPGSPTLNQATRDVNCSWWYSAAGML